MGRSWTALLATTMLAMMFAACSTTHTTSAMPPVCGTEPPTPAPIVGLAYPSNGTTGVPTNLSEVVFQGYPTYWLGSLEIVLSPKHGSSAVQLGAATAPPSPLPSPLEMHAKLPTIFFARPVKGLLAPNTSYQAYLFAVDWSSYPGPEALHCAIPVQYSLGLFRTGSGPAP